ncbi:MAG: AI-2E family transporter [Acidimicrobiales bacterium]
MIDRLRRAGQVSWAMVGVAVLLAVLGLVAWTVRVVFPPLVLASAIVFLLNPVVNRLQRRGLPRAAGAGIAYLGVFAGMAACVVLVAPIAANQADELSGEWPGIQDRIERWLDDRAEESRGTIFEFTRQELEDSFSSADTPFPEQLQRLRKVGVQVFHVLLVILLAPIIAFYLLVDLPRTRRVAEGLVPEGAKPEVMHVCRHLNRAIGGYFRGQLTVALIVGVLCSIGLAVIGLRFWFLIGMIAGVANLVPLVGPWIGGIPGLAIAFTTGSTVQALGVVIIMAAVQQVDNHFITPQVMQRAVHLHPAAVMLALLAGGTLGGFFGLLLAVPVAAALKILVGHVWRTHILGQPLEAAVVAQEASAADAGEAVAGVAEVEAQGDKVRS